MAPLVTPPRERRRAAAGFTLIEVLVAMVVMAIMSLMAWQGVDGIVRTRDINQERLEQTLRLQTVIAQWEQDLANLQQSVVPTLLCDGKTVRMTRRAASGMQVVAWSLNPDANGSSVWQRWASPAVTTTTALRQYWFQTFQFQGNEAGQLRAIPGLDQWQVYFFFNNAWANCQSTGDVATGPGGTGAGQQQALPAGVRVVLGFAPGSGMAGNLTRDTLIAP